MNEQQYERWKEFSLKMAAHYPHVTFRRQARIAEYVERWFACVPFEEAAHIHDWDSSDKGWLCASDHYSEWSDGLPGYWLSSLQRKMDNEQEWRFENQVCCCIRAGLDMAAAPSAGVMGFTVGDLRAMYEGTIPDWITGQYQTDLNHAPDTAGIWL